jgi:hypothetical protein
MEMAQSAKELQQLKGIGDVLAQRLKDAGLESYNDLVGAGEEGLKKIRGLNPQAIPSILVQAKELSQVKDAAKAERIEAIRMRIGALREKLNRLAETTRERFSKELEGKCGKKLNGNLDRTFQALDRMDKAALKKMKRAVRGLIKAEKGVEGLEEAGLKKVRKRLKRSRKALVKALA